MTAEIAVMNRLAIALASDSAATSLHGNVAKIFNADKLFQLDWTGPVAVMFYQSSTFLGIPWEIVVKQFRAARSAERAWLKEYANDLLAFLTSNELVSDQFIDNHFWTVCRGTIREVLGQAKALEQEHGGDQLEHCKAVVNKALEHLKNRDFLSPMGEGTVVELRQRYGAELVNLVTDSFKKLGPPDSELTERMADVLLLFMTKDVPHEFTGAVIAGYGTAELFPGFIEFTIEGVVYPRILRYRKVQEKGISLETRARIVPFAQAEMVQSFMEGVDPKFKENAITGFTRLLEKLTDLMISKCPTPKTEDEKTEFSNVIKKAMQTASSELAAELTKYSQKFHVRPIMDAVALLPKDQLAVMAETLVNLTSFKRRMSKDLETVGGPIDVAVISKGDGFVWIKRKHYFDTELNPRYLNRLQAVTESKTHDA
jgi:hypothetical protein